MAKPKLREMEVDRNVCDDFQIRRRYSNIGGKDNEGRSTY